MNSAVIVFPGSNCDRDMAVALENILGRKPHMVWHGDNALPDGLDFVAIPGGFSYGDYLRSGAMAARANIIPALLKAAQNGVAILGVCNGFQILTEIGLLPGALLRNKSMKFICRTVSLTVGERPTCFTHKYVAQQKIDIPVAHHDGNYFADDATLKKLHGNGQIAFRYAEDVNGSAENIAGITNETGNILGMMPHPERAVDRTHGGTDGIPLFESLLN